MFSMISVIIGKQNGLKIKIILKITCKYSEFYSSLGCKLCFTIC